MENLRKGEIKFIERFERIHGEKPKGLKPHEIEPKIKHTIEEIKKEIEKLPEIQQEKEEFHPQMPISQITNVLAQAIQLAIEEGVEEALKFIYKTKNPYLIDAFHDILIGHFSELLSKE